MATTLIAQQPAASRTEPQGLGGKYLTFQLGKEEFGLPILKVREINGLLDITALPQMPAYMKGVINLRGSVVPVIDLRLKFGLPPAEYGEQTCIILVNAGRQIGIIVDTVSEVINVSDANIDPPPTLGQSLDSSFILGMGKVGDAVKILLDIDRVLTTGELNRLTAIASEDKPESL